MSKDLASGIGMLALSIVVYVGAGGIGSSYMADPIGPQGLPRALSLVLGGLAAVLVAKSLYGLWKRRGATSEGASVEPWRRHLLALGMLAIGGAYVLIAEIAGYVVGIALVILVTTLYQGAGRTWRAPLIAVGGALSFWLLFVVVLDIGQPEGIWPRLLNSLGV